MATVALNNDNYSEIIDKNDIVVIDFWANWCGPCKMFKPVFEKASETYKDITFASCDTEQATEVAALFGVRAIPTLAIFRDQILLFQQAGALPEKAFNDLLDQVKGLDMDEVRAKIAEEEQKARAEANAKEAEKPAEVSNN